MLPTEGRPTTVGSRSGARRWLAGVVAIVLLAAPTAARAAYYIAPSPEYVRGIWLRLGFTSEGLFSIGLAFDALPATAGIDFSPGSALGPLRVFAGAKVGTAFTPITCSTDASLSGGAVYAFGPGRAGHFGLRLGAHLEHVPMGYGAALSFPQLEQALSYRFSWFPRAGMLHEGSADLGLYWAPGGDCESD